LKKNEEDDEEL